MCKPMVQYKPDEPPLHYGGLTGLTGLLKDLTSI